MLKTTSQEFRTFFLLEFTKELIKNSVPESILKLETIVNGETQQKKEEIKERPQQVILQRRFVAPQRRIINYQPLPKPLTLGLNLQPLPPRLQYIKPVPREIDMDLGKLNNLINDFSVESIECDGPDKNIIVNTPNARVTNIILTTEEINLVVEEFSKLSRIPAGEGVYKVAAGKLILLAAISDIVGTKFIIKRIPPLQQNIIPR